MQTNVWKEKFMDGGECIFCKIIRGDFNTEFVLETQDLVAFNDINPQAPTHILVVPKKHYSNLNEVDSPELLGKLMQGVIKVVKKLNLENYRVVINTGMEAGQTVFHLHIHILSGRLLKGTLG